MKAEPGSKIISKGDREQRQPLVAMKSRLAIFAITFAMGAVLVLPLTLFLNPDALFSGLYWVGIGVLLLLCGVYAWREGTSKQP